MANKTKFNKTVQPSIQPSITLEVDRSPPPTLSTESEPQSTVDIVQVMGPREESVQESVQESIQESVQESVQSPFMRQVTRDQCLSDLSKLMQASWALRDLRIQAGDVLGAVEAEKEYKVHATEYHKVKKSPLDSGE